MKLLKTLSVLLLSGVIATSCGKKKEADSAEMTDSTAVVMDTTVVVETPNIVGVASANADFSTLVTAVKAAGLVETLSGEGPFTVFAPNNAAFAKLPAGTVDGLLKPENVEKLKAVLTYHVVAGKFDAATVTDAINKNNGKYSVKTVQGGTIVLSLMDGKVMLTDEKGGSAMVILADVAASNGVIHAIDSVVMPK
ncbi:putative surface protein with fasciclin (FAS1) repeats [Flavobacterium sp. CG_23.5]|uniref:fasciclin domain-containing protein n=1 Tax=unclassified Flavobacterium TaxID=196869 RepID=UPI0018CB987C|nr:MULTISPECIES: fasciclin domain-containing protein [unclassified Flavobacterium]MBG6110205.1 putative surface protein with fasciclin (FAS1) repeats [Flavobacterium sp. CG_9.10]MBP2281798.1 putative surface protein with fasciclin (FAS1) repeats [Flavobacterium sp. CG_23.5]